ncbi:radical SAM protein [Calderihabitans maritimus]|uniref:Radical SAM protein n=1 Tax=Calderihabitans maritimus TaxID=1246530 RepID=A0A1Z5HUU5_9FIRM|nr:radical SAM protein [Calderihabitans maritimus]GAW93060.1 radical SAM protein [Calderihabitans maritimus]
MKPAYLNLSQKELKARKEEAYRRLEKCNICPHECQVDRIQDEKGVCRAGSQVAIASYGPHFGEEEPLVGRYGSGTIFFTYCNLKCVYCQNYEISCGTEGKEISIEELADIMTDLQEMKCHNINLVTPTHYVPQILAALEKAVQKGLKIPLVYNCGGYESLATLKLLDGIIDIYMPDMKYSSEEVARKYSGIRNYPETVKKAVKEMYRQVGDLQVDEHGVALRGLIIRHLVLPERLAGTTEIMRFIAQEISPTAFVNIMEQYYPAYRAKDFPPLNRRISPQEYLEALEEARRAGLKIK